MNLEEIMLSDISQLQNDKYCIIPLNELETESRIVVIPAGGRRKRVVFFLV